MRIYSRWDNEKVLYEGDHPTMRHAVAAAVMAEVDLAEADLTGADLTGADLTGAILTGANLTEANLTEAILTESDLTEADLTEANLTWANLTWANLTWANLTGADLTEAILTRADLTRAKGITCPVLQIQGSRDWLTTLPDGQIAIGCEIHAINEWLTQAEKIGRVNNYSEGQIKEYQIYLRAVAEVMKLGESCQEQNAD